MAAQANLNNSTWIFWGNGGGFGSAVQGAGDMDGDGLTEVLVSAPNNQGQVYVFSSTSMGVSDMLLAEDADAVWTGGLEGAELGSAMVAMGDIDGDGLSDVALGAPGVSDQTGIFWSPVHPVFLPAIFTRMLWVYWKATRSRMKRAPPYRRAIWTAMG